MVASTSFTQLAQPASVASARASVSRQQAVLDAMLVRRFNEGDESAFVAIVTHYREKMFAVALAHLRNRADAEEIAQDTFIRAHRGLGNFRGQSSLATWLHRITLNLARNRYWYNFRRCRHTTRSLDCPLGEGSVATLADLIACDAPSPVRETAISEYAALVAVCMDRLDSGHRSILIKRNTLNWSYEEIAIALGVAVGTVKSRLARAREKLRALLAEACPEFTPDSAPSAWFDSDRSCGLAESLCA
jgi:RNA polymerase sigma-70 factor (ECF subfamily)